MKKLLQRYTWLTLSMLYHVLACTKVPKSFLRRVHIWEVNYFSYHFYPITISLFLDYYKPSKFASNFQVSILPPLPRHISASCRIMYCMHLASGMPHHLPYYFHLEYKLIVTSSQGKNKWNMFGLIFLHSIHLFCS